MESFVISDPTYPLVDLPVVHVAWWGSWGETRKPVRVSLAELPEIDVESRARNVS